METSTLGMLGPTTEIHSQPQPISPSLLSHRHENRSTDTHRPMAMVNNPQLKTLNLGTLRFIMCHTCLS